MSVAFFLVSVWNNFCTSIFCYSCGSWTLPDNFGVWFALLFSNIVYVCMFMSINLWMNVVCMYRCVCFYLLYNFVYVNVYVSLKSFLLLVMTSSLIILWLIFIETSPPCFASQPQQQPQLRYQTTNGSSTFRQKQQQKQHQYASQPTTTIDIITINS